MTRMTQAVPVMTTMAAKSVFPEDHELALGTGGHSGTLMAARFLERADLVLAVGSSLTKSTFAYPLPEQAVIAQVTNDPVDLNRADHEALTSIPGVGEVLALRIVAHREAHGPFLTMEDLLDVPGIGEGRLAGMRDYVEVGR